MLQQQSCSRSKGHHPQSDEHVLEVYYLCDKGFRSASVLKRTYTNAQIGTGSGGLCPQVLMQFIESHGELILCQCLVISHRPHCVHRASVSHLQLDTHRIHPQTVCVFVNVCVFVCPHAAKKQINLRYTVCLYHRKQSVAQATISFVILLSVKSVETHNNKSRFSLKPTVIAIYPSVSKPKESGTAYLCVLKDEYPKAGPI